MAIKDNIIASASSDRSISLWNLETGRQIYSFFEPKEVYAVAINSQIVAGGNFARKITSWKLDNKALDRTFFSQPYDPFYRQSFNQDSHDGLIYDLIFSNDGKTLISGSADRTIRIWDAVTGRLKSTLQGHTDSVLSLAISSCDKFLISSSADKTIRIWDLNNPLAKPDFLIEHSDWVTAVAITPDDKYLVSGSRDSTIDIWCLKTKKLVDTLRGHTDAIWSIAISPDGKNLASANLNGEVIIWDLATKEKGQNLHASSPVCFSKDGKYLITGNSRNQIEVWQRLTKNYTVFSGKEWWEILGINKYASPREIKIAYYNLARQYHPDLNPFREAQQIMQIINQAYQQAQKQYN